MDVDLVEKIGNFKCQFLLYISNLIDLDVSGCTSINTQEFSEMVVACCNLERISLKGCIQFTQMSMLNIISRLPRLRSVDLEGCSEFHMQVAYWMISSLNNLEVINFEPANPVSDIVDWKRLFQKFVMVNFGVRFTRVLPNSGIGLRVLPDM